MTGPCLQQHKIRALIGEGMLGTVYAVEHRVLRRQAMLKLLHPGCRRQMTALLEQARAVRAFRHPQVAEVLEVGQLLDGQPYVMSELLAGETLGDRLRRLGCLPIPDALDFAMQAARALGAAHEHGLVHRGLTREDLFLSTDLRMRRGERVTLSDFGLAHLRRPAVLERVAGDLPGTALYLAPEQLQPRHRVDYRADIYALGGILYHALCGAAPFVAGSRAALARMHLEELPARPRSLNPDVPARVEAAILRALAKRPDDRFASMAAFARALEAATLRVAPPRRRLPAATMTMTVAACLVLVLAARAPAGGVASPAPRPVARAVRGPTIVPMPSAHDQRKPVKRRSARSARRPLVLAAGSVLERDDLWGQRR
jgi:serine/threonine protein kinase